MNITKKENGSELCISLEGRLDTNTSPELEAELSSSLDNVTALTLDLSKLDYISSAGLRVLLATQKKMNAQGKMTVTGVNESVNEIFEITGFSDILNIE